MLYVESESELFSPWAKLLPKSVVQKCTPFTQTDRISIWQYGVCVRAHGSEDKTRNGRSMSVGGRTRSFIKDVLLREGCTSKRGAWSCNYSMKTRALTPPTSVCSDSCAPSCMCVTVWCNLSHRFAQFLHSWASQYSRLRYVTASSPALPPARAAHALVHSHLLPTHARRHKPTPVMSVNLLLSFPLSICLPISVSLSCIQICLSFLLSVRLCIFTQSPLICIYFIRFYVCVRACLFACSYLPLSLPPSLSQVQPEHCKPLARCQTFVLAYLWMQR